MIPALISLVATLFLLLVSGFICRKVGVINDASSKALSRLIISVGQPMLALSALANAAYTPENLTIAWQVTLIGCVVHPLLALIALPISRRIKDENRSKVFEFALVFGNCGFIGFPILDSIFGAGTGSFMGAFFIISYNVFMWTWGRIILGRGRSDIRITLRSALINYGTVPCAIGIVIFLLNPYFELPDFFGRCFSYLGGLCTPISLLVTGALIATLPIAKLVTNRLLYTHIALRMLVIPVVFCLLAKLCGLNDTYILFITAMTAVPCGAVVSMFGELYDIDPAFASQTVGTNSIMTVLTMPVVILFAQWVISW